MTVVADHEPPCSKCGGRWCSVDLCLPSDAPASGAGKVDQAAAALLPPEEAAKVCRNMCYGCNRVEAPAGDTAPFYCGGCAEWDAYTSDPGDDVEPEE